MSIDEATPSDWDKVQRDYDREWGRRPKTISELVNIEALKDEAARAETMDKDKLTEGQKASTNQIGGSHYKKYPIQPYKFCLVNGLNNLQSEVISYVVRYKDKGGKKDLEKAIHSLELLIEEEYGK